MSTEPEKPPFKPFYNIILTFTGVNKPVCTKELSLIAEVVKPLADLDCVRMCLFLPDPVEVIKEWYNSVVPHTSLPTFIFSDANCNYLKQFGCADYKTNRVTVIQHQFSEKGSDLVYICHQRKACVDVPRNFQCIYDIIQQLATMVPCENS